MSTQVCSRPMTRHEMFIELSKYPDPPLPFGDPVKIEVPAAPAIYFLYNEGRIEYVGKSKDLYQRIGGILNACRHHALEDGDEISWIEFYDERVLEFVECFYIWLCRPSRNFGRKEEAFMKRMLLRQSSRTSETDAISV